MRPYFLGCPSWADPAWRGSVFADDVRASDFLSHYAQVFNAVEGNTTFYAKPSEQTVARWAQQMPDDFRFCAKIPREISHSVDLTEQLEAALFFRQLLSPLAARVAPYWLQLPSSFGPERLDELAEFLRQWGQAPLAVEVRHLEFFNKGDAERRLNRLLDNGGFERICLDSRPLFSCASQEPAVLHAQAKKPRLPVRPAAFSQHPQVRFIGHPELEANDRFMAPWLAKVASWIEQGLSPYVFLHTSDNRRAPDLARRFHQQLMLHLPGLEPLPEPPVPAAQQLGLL